MMTTHDTATNKCVRGYTGIKHVAKQCRPRLAVSSMMRRLVRVYTL